MAATFKETARIKLTVLRDAFRSRAGFKYFIETRDTSLDEHSHPNSKQTWSNEDLDPTPPEKRTCVFDSAKLTGASLILGRAMVEFRHFLYGIVLWKLDVGVDNGWIGTLVVGEYIGHIC